MLEVEALDADTDTTLRVALESRLQWRRRIAYLADKGLPEKRILHWAWILSSDDGDVMVHRFTHSREPKPLFLLLHILGKDKEFREKETFISLVSHIQKHYVRGKEPFSNYHRFAILVDQLIKKCLVYWPPMLVPVARLTAEYIKRIPLEASRSRRTHGYRSRCVVFNKAIRALGLAPIVDRQTSREFCWEAQKILLECSSITTPHLTIDRKSYQSIREVLLGLNKTGLETKVALRSSKSWPPYREAWDGTDERRRPEDDLSRSAKAGILMHEAGYQSTPFDEALTVLGGSFSGRRPTVQTKSLSIKHNKAHENAQAYTLWVSRMEATRNAREAWQVFQTPPTPGVSPPTDVYAVMFEKLFALPVTALEAVVPGDTKRVFPVFNGNLSAFSIARLEPPDPKLLYAKMREQGLPPVGRCLAVLIRHAEDIEEALHYLKESPYKWAASVFELRAYAPLEYSPTDLGAMRQKLSFIPVSIFAAWISTLCRLHSYDHYHPGCDTNIPDAIFLVRLYRPKAPLFATAPLYRAIAGSLAGNKVIRSNKKAAHNFAPTLSTFLGAFVQWKSTTQSTDERMFFYLCIVIRKAMRFMLFSQVSGSRTINTKTTIFSFMNEYGTLLHRFHQGVVFEFNELVKLTNQKESCEKSGLVLPPVLVSLRPGSFGAYMQALGLFGDTKEMVRLVDWLFDGYTSGGVLSTEFTTPGYYQDVDAALAYLDGIATEMIDPAELARLKDRLQWLRTERGCVWSFPAEGGRDLRDVRYDLICARLWRHVDIPSVKVGTPSLEEPTSLQKEHDPVAEPSIQTTVPPEQILDWKHISDQDDVLVTFDEEAPMKRSKRNDIAIQEEDFLKIFEEGFCNEKSQAAKEEQSKEDLLAVFDREVPWEVSPGADMVVEEQDFLKVFEEDISDETDQSVEKEESEEESLKASDGEGLGKTPNGKDIVPGEDFINIIEESLSGEKGEVVDGGGR